MGYDSSQIAIVDTETTGLHPELHPVWEIAVIVDFNEHVWQQKVSEHDIEDAEPVALEMTGFHDRYDDTKALPVGESINRLAYLVQGRHIVGACPWFDSERLHRQWREIHADLWSMPWHYHLIDVENLAVGYLAGQGVYFNDRPVGLPWKSKELSMLLGVDPDRFQPAHTALADARWAKAMYEKIMGNPQ